MSAEANAAHHAGPTPTEYIQHHLQHLQKNFSFESVKQTSIVDFSVFNLDSLVFSIVLGVLGCWVLWLAARRATSGVPGRFQALVEILAEGVENQAKGVIHNAQSRKLISPLALTVAVWIFLMNFMDMIPVDLLPGIWHSAGPALGFKDYLRVVPTADLSTTLGLSTSVLFVCLVYNVKIKGVGGWAHELIAAPFGDKWFLYPVNFLMQVIEYVAKTVSHGMRLFGNMFAGELVFMLIALMGGVWAFQFNPVSGGFWLGVGHVVAGTVWTLFHILVITLQAFIFMMLTLIYTGQAHDAH
ncbi:F0F1 ATP synthase subunit A [Piscinibacter gummiphilus]|uniref:ATP synthase subunit a n=1 Tax=Piscinibacter gummiphilus TaxID=946333 RepID=A0A1W6LGM3_9BURK|nr:F0F1 ATP synthase subunit A [Piscinibacter gummiphilus]ARN23347.1 F0F1 ATP synthase subunit A [Piscinibacter gummiphilus]ATU68048.1 F0F1 ATP synthase subunit A [Piscinibacter gummiphilus]GLS97347.1 ATP synthase subunit a [Piscinibacter gummiphilus]